MRLRREGSSAHLAGVLLALVLLAPSLALRGIWPPDEARYADVALGMLEGNSPIVPRLHGEPYPEKPPVFFWSIAALTRLGVDLDAAPRLISMLAAALTVALLPVVGRAAGLGRALSGRAAVVLATTPLFLVYGQMGLVDSLLTLLVTLAIAAKLLRDAAPGGRRGGWIALEGVALGAALLTKGPVCLLYALGLRVGALASGPDAAGRPDRSDLASLALAGALAASWLWLAVGEAGSAYALDLTVGQLRNRLAGEAPHLRFPGYLLIATAFGLVPWLCFGLRGIADPDGPGRGWRSPRIAALAGWFAVPIAVLSVLPSQQPHYALPALPAAALLLARASRASTARPVALFEAVAGGLLIGAGLAAPAVAEAATSPFVRAFAGDPLLRASLVAGGGALGVLALAARRPGRLGEPWVHAALGSAALFASVLVGASRADPLIAPRALVEHPQVASAARLMLISKGLMSYVHVSTRRPARELGVPHFLDFVPLLERKRLFVGVVWREELERLAEPGQVEEIATGRMYGRELVAIRAAPRPPRAS